MISFATDSIWLVEPTWIDDGGTQVADLGEPASVTKVDNCSVQPGATSEVLELRQGVTINYTVLAPTGITVDAHYGVRLSADGPTYAIEGEPQPWSSPLGGVDHTVILITKRKG